MDADKIDASVALKECDLVMKGGVTSGVVYPTAVLELAKAYRLRSIGGASAGAIAAGFTAAAEYGRQTGDAKAVLEKKPVAFQRFETRCNEIPEILGGLFQANGRFKPLFAAALALVGDGSTFGKLMGVLGAFRGALLKGAAIWGGLYGLLAVVLGVIDPGWSTWLLGVVGLVASALVGSLLTLALRLRRLIFTELPKADFGLCSGLADPGETRQVLTQWLHDSLQVIAFGSEGGRPLTFGDLRKAGLDAKQIKAGEVSIALRMMTTNLSVGRPHVLPDLEYDLHYRRDEWAKLFPADVLDHLETCSKPHKDDPKLRRLPQGDELPVLVGVRMSLSFPILFRAVPLHMIDRGEAQRGESKGPARWRRLLFSDGGITSNFPIHFFDSLLPLRPTFALSLDERPVDAPKDMHVRMPTKPEDGAFSPIHDLPDVGKFAGSLFRAAKDWQDELQSTMPGQRQRVVRVLLDKNEGGLNLNMPPQRSRDLMRYGREAGQEILAKFDFERHRYLRTLVAYPALERLLRAFDAEWGDYGPWFAAYKTTEKIDYATRVEPPMRDQVETRLNALRAVSSIFTPPLARSVNFPRRRGQLRVMPILDPTDD